MTRGGFLKSLLALTVAPKAIIEIAANLSMGNVVSTSTMLVGNLISDLQLLTPMYYQKYVERYGSEEFVEWLGSYGGMKYTENRDFYWFENKQNK